MAINLTLNFEYPVGASSHTATYARIDNTLNPSVVTVPGITTSPATIAENVPNGQYQMTLVPVWPDGRVCTPTTVYTPACPGLISISAYIDGTNLIVSYLAPSEAPKVRITVNYPNGGSFTGNYVNNGNDIAIALPPNLYGDFSVLGQSVCDEDSGFFSPFSNQVVVNRSETNVTIINLATGLTIDSVTGITGFTLGSFITTGNTATGSHDAFYGSIQVTFQGTPSSQSATLRINGTLIQCVDLAPSTTVVFSAASFGTTDDLEIEFSNGICP